MSGFRSGFASFVGRPNAGKSTLTNALVGQKIVITSDKPQTTRTVVRGIVHRPDAQLVLVDTPGLHRPRTLLGERLNDLVRTTWAEVDVVAVCFPCDEKIGPGDRYIVSELTKVRRTTKIAVATKTDLAAPQRIGEHLLEIARLGEETGTPWAEIVPVSAVAHDQVDLLADLLVGMLPEGPMLYPDGELTDAPEELLVADLIREAALEGVRDELPHSIAVVVEEMGLRPDRPDDKPLLDVHANLYVERDSQKGIVIGRKGARLKDVGSRARASIEAMLGTPVYLDLHVKIAKDWQRDPRQLKKAGVLMTNRPAPVAAWHAIVEARDPAGLDALLDDLLDDAVVFRSPAIHTPQEGKDLTTMYLSAAVVVLGPTLTYRHEWYDDSSAVLEFEAELDGLTIHGIDMLRWGESGRLTEFTVMVRPFKGLTKLMEQMLAQLPG